MVAYPTTDGELTSFIRDITEQKRFEQRLLESEARYRAIGESIEYGVWVCDATGRNTYASDSFLRMVGITQQQCSDFGWGDVLHPDDAEATLAAWRECVQTQERWDRVHRFKGVDGQWHHVLARGVPLRDETGNETQTAHDGVEAVEKAAAFRPNVILLDIGLPKMNGYAACRAIREQPWGKDIVMIALTGWGQDEDRRKSNEAGFDVHMVKPVDHSKLMLILAFPSCRPREEQTLFVTHGD